MVLQTNSVRIYAKNVCKSEIQKLVTGYIEEMIPVSESETPT